MTEEKKRPKFNPRSELKVFSIILLSVFLLMTVFTNAEMFAKVIFQQQEELVFDRSESEESNISIQHNITNQDFGNMDDNIDENIDELLVNNKNIQEIDLVAQMENELKNNVKQFTFDFNTLPPTNRIVIAKIGLDVPLVDSKFKNKVDFTDGNFDTELSNGVVKYPTTPNPGLNGNSLIFGHTSQEWRKNNYYSTVFVNITKLEKGDTFQIIREGKIFEYEITNKEIVLPSKVNEIYNQFHNEFEDYITLMGCYPIGSSSKRILVIAKRIIK